MLYRLSEPFLTLPLAPRDELHPWPLVVKLSHRGNVHPFVQPQGLGGEPSLLFRRMEERTENFTPT
jgi:hypothetical protein